MPEISNYAQKKASNIPTKCCLLCLQLLNETHYRLYKKSTLLFKNKITAYLSKDHQVWMKIKV